MSILTPLSHWRSWGGKNRWFRHDFTAFLKHTAEGVWAATASQILGLQLQRISSTLSCHSTKETKAKKELRRWQDLLLNTQKSHSFSLPLKNYPPWFSFRRQPQCEPSHTLCKPYMCMYRTQLLYSKWSTTRGPHSLWNGKTGAVICLPVKYVIHRSVFWALRPKYCPNTCV